MSDSQSTGPLARDPQMPSAGDVLNHRYVIREALGEGGFAVVYRADDKTTGAQVAVKVMDPIMSRRDELAQRFLREVETVSRLRHHHTIKVSDKGETANGCLFLVMELLEGVPLDSFLDNVGTVEPERVRQIAIQILKSLAEAHSQGVMHRDLKPANIFLVDLVGEDEDFIKVLDFGIAKSLDDEDAALTSTGQVMCSPHYVAPERVADHVTVPASDLYSLGVMMIELLEGDVPYDASTPIQIVLQHARIDNPVPMKPETMNGPLGPIIERSVAKRYGQRYQSAREMLTALQDLGPIEATSAARAPTRAADVDTHDLSRKMTTADAMAGSLSRDVPPPTLAVSATPDGFSDEPNTRRKSATPLLIALGLFLVLTALALVFYLTMTDGEDSEVAEQTQTATATTRTREPRQEPPIADDASRITITTSPENAAIRVGDQFVGTAPVTLPHESFRSFPIEVRAELSSGVSRSVVIQSAEELGEDLNIEFDENEVAVNSGETEEGSQNVEASDDSQTNDETAENSDDDQRAGADSPQRDDESHTDTGSNEQQRPPEIFVETTPTTTRPNDQNDRPNTDTRPPRTNPNTHKPDTTRPSQPLEPTQPTQPSQPTPNTLPDRTPLPPSNTGGYGGSSGRDAGSGGSYWGR